MLKRFLLLFFMVSTTLVLSCNSSTTGPNIAFLDSGGQGDSACVPDCKDRECGSDGCGGTCWKETGDQCDDGLDCTADACKQGKCTHEVSDGYCVINGKCVQDGAKSADNPCLVCNSKKNNNAFSPADNGIPCGNNGGVCFNGGCCQPDCKNKSCGDNGCGGDCAGPDGCSDNLDCTKDFCDTSFNCQHKINAGYCLIDGKCYKAGDANPAKDCEVCKPSSGQDKWSQAKDGAQCTDGICRNGACCKPQCENKECGDDGCGGTCGDCGPLGACDKSGKCYTAGDSCGAGISCIDNSVSACIGMKLYVLNCTRLGMKCECDKNLAKCSKLTVTNGIRYACTKDGCSGKDKCIKGRIQMSCDKVLKVEQAVDCMQFGEICDGGKCVKPGNQPCGNLVPAEGLCAGTFAFSCVDGHIKVQNCALSRTYCDYSQNTGMYQCIGQ